MCEPVDLCEQTSGCSFVMEERHLSCSHFVLCSLSLVSGYTFDSFPNYYRGGGAGGSISPPEADMLSATTLKVFLDVFPTEVTPVIAATESNAARRAYSIIVAPRWWRRCLNNSLA